MDGMVVHMVSSATNIMTGEAQIHARGYQDDLSFYKSIPDPPSILEKAAENGILAAPRSYGFGLVSVGTKSAGALFWGIDPVLEKKAFDLAGNLMQGQFISEQATKGIVLGRKLALSLHAAVGTELIVVVQAADGSLGNDLYHVTGVLKSVGEDVDRGAAIMHRNDFEKLFVSGGRIHEIALNSKGMLPPEAVKQLFIDSAGLDVKTWRELSPALADMVGIMDAAIAIFGAIFFLAAGLGVMNTMLMATFDRIKEFGVLKAIGTSPLRIVGGMAAEALVLTVAASGLGLIIGLAGTYYLQEVGIDTSIFAGNFTFSGLAWDPIWKAVINIKIVAVPVIVMCVICTLASLYPAFIAARLDPVKAIHHV